VYEIIVYSNLLKATSAWIFISITKGNQTMLVAKVIHHISFLLILLLVAPAGAPAGEPPLPPERTGLLYVSGFSSDNVGEYLPDGTLLRTFTAAGLDQPRGVGIDESGNVVVVGQGSDKIYIFDLDGNLINEVSHPDLTSGTGLARSGDGDWYVANFSPGRVLVFDPAWTHLTSIEVTGMSGVNCVAFDQDGHFAVTDALNAVVHLFDAAHNHLGTATHTTLGSPMSIAVDSLGDHFVSNGSTSVITKFDANWNYVTDFGGGILSGPQGIVIDENDVLTVTNISSSTVHRFDRNGNLLGSAALSGLTTMRNLSWQYSPHALARAGVVNAANGYPVAVLAVNGTTGDAMGRMQIGAADPITVTVDTSPAGPLNAPFVLYAFVGEPGPADSLELPYGAGPFAFAPPFKGGSPVVLVNSIGFTGILGTGLLPSVHAPGTAVNMPGGFGSPAIFTLQAILSDQGSEGTISYSSTNAIVLEIQ